MFIFLIFLILLIIGVPIGFSLVVSSVVFILHTGGLELMSMAAQRIYSGLTGFTLLAIPFFLFAGLLMNTGGVSRRIFNFASALVGHITGGLGHVKVLASMIFAGMSGSAVADAAGLGAIEIQAMKDEGFDPGFSAAITAASSTIGPVIPPSIPMVLFAGLTGTSVGRMFLGGIVPGLIMGFGMILVVYFTAKKRKYPVRPKASFRQVVHAFLDALPSLMMPVILLVGIFGGFFTPTEAAAVASIYAFILGAVVYKEIKPKDLLSMLKETLRGTIQVMSVIGPAALFGWLLAYQKVPEAIIETLLTLTQNKWIILLMIQAICLVLGCFMEGLSILVLTIPVIMPLANTYGIDLVHLGVIMTLNTMVGVITPPVGMCLYPAASLAKIPLHVLIKEIWVYIIALIIILVILALVPPLVTFVPTFFMG